MERRRLLIAGLACASLPGVARAQNAAALAREYQGLHPATYYVAADRLMQAGQRDDAVFIFYLGQLRFRTHLAARPELPRDRDAAVFASLSERVGRPVNEYAFGDMPALLRTLDAVMVYDRENPDPFTPAATYPDATRSACEGMAQFRTNLAGRFDEIRRLRAANGLENR
ncbi:hypothetical protein [Plastoroseomonas arctica]|uniref:Uncharacterized protein n=1 Tax=Plastoroseomonas arctica TaxID=1509237 RepID=A0AAF1JX70_9PROT|nr:hypothetical protein [Plastoroseomonas arctica]MBR0655891.1 hypothetical protein [Plastoroseomonas arctica]